MTHSKETNLYELIEAYSQEFPESGLTAALSDYAFNENVGEKFITQEVTWVLKNFEDKER